MTKNQPPRTTSAAQQLDAFLKQASKLPQRHSSDACSTGRLIFALDATASRQPSWDRACQLQVNMFMAASTLGGLAVQLCYYRGFHEFHHSAWLQDSQRLLKAPLNNGKRSLASRQTQDQGSASKACWLHVKKC